MADSRKRANDSEDEAPAKKSHYPGGTEPLVKLLVPTYVAGALIGKGGVVMNELRAQHGGNIRISATKEVYPGTSERVVVLTGETQQILSLNQHIMQKVEDPGRDGTLKKVAIDQRRAGQAKIVLTNGAAGLLIGKGGITIKTIQSQSQAYLSIAPTNEGPVLGERVLTVTGTMEQRVEAFNQIVAIIAMDSSNMANTSLRYPELHTTAGMMMNMARTQGTGRKGVMNGVSFEEQDLVDKIASKLTALRGGNGTKAKLEAEVQVTIEVPQALVGGILGKGGAIVKEFSKMSGGAKFKFAEKSEVADTISRTLTITGNMDQAYQAYNMLNERVGQLEMEQQHQQPQQQQAYPAQQQGYPQGYQQQGYPSEQLGYPSHDTTPYCSSY